MGLLHETTSKLKNLFQAKEALIEQHRIIHDYVEEESRERIKVILWLIGVRECEADLVSLFRGIRTAVPKQWMVEIVIRASL